MMARGPRQLDGLPQSRSSGKIAAKAALERVEMLNLRDRRIGESSADKCSGCF